MLPIIKLPLDGFEPGSSGVTTTAHLGRGIVLKYYKKQIKDIWNKPSNPHPWIAT